MLTADTEGQKQVFWQKSPMPAPAVLDETEPDADAMWEDETAWVAEQTAMLDETEPDADAMEEEKTDVKSEEEQDVDWQEAQHGWGSWMQQNGVRRKPRKK